MTDKPGPTGRFPLGKSAPDDKGELTTLIGRDVHGNVRIDFGVSVEWIAMPPAMAVEFAQRILDAAKDGDG